MCYGRSLPNVSGLLSQPAHPTVADALSVDSRALGGQVTSSSAPKTRYWLASRGARAYYTKASDGMFEFHLQKSPKGRGQLCMYIIVKLFLPQAQLGLRTLTLLTLDPLKQSFPRSL